ncbi:MAG TPA: amidohydrolase [Adlercreutzia equolifaciens]|uniref:amidohydrolase n=1 Tax=Adlercreutzia equolifaciens TaxID=446660 RepID=UPI00242FEF5A|nr:amidohydrolase [Adlercreutzia equolifaciens]HJI11236.1 amidohydrolase [Adlercreutzia equolifaciens]
MKEVFYGGPIITMDADNPTTEAVLVEDGRIAAVGDKESILQAAGDDYDEINLCGNTLMPGLIEPHAHIDIASITHKTHFVGGLKYDTADEVLAEIRKKIEETPAGRWIFCFGLDYLINRDLPELDRFKLDEFTTEHPLIILVQSMHTAFLNSKGLEAAGITRDTPDPRDGHIYKLEDGEPNGVITEQTLIFPLFIAWLSEQGKTPEDLMREQYAEFKRKGITTTWTAGMMSVFPNQLQLMKEWAQNAPVRQDYAIAFNNFENGSMSLDDVPEDDEKFKFTGIKFWYDGSPYTGNMFMEENYLDNDIMQKSLQVPPSQAGERLFDPDFLYGVLKKYHNMGYQISVHSQGDRSNRELIDLFERLLTEFPREDHRHRIEHCAFMRPEDVQRCADLGITLSYHINHLYYYGEALNELVIGEERMNDKFMRCRDALDAGIRISLHSDDPMYFADPLLLASTAATRTSKKGNLITGGQAISLDEALRAITVDAAWQMGREDELGSIEPGKLADFTVLSENPYDVDIDDLKNINVVTTYLSGRNTDTMLS